MEESRFIGQIADLLYCTCRGTLNRDTYYKSLREWNMWLAVSITLMIYEECRVELTLDDFNRTRTLGELYGLVCARRVEAMGKQGDLCAELQV